MPRLKGVEVAAELGLNKSTVSRQARAWNLVGADGLIDLDAYRARRETERNPLMVRDQPSPAAAPDPPSGSVASAAAEHKSLQAELLRLRLDREAGRQLDAAAVGSEVAEAGGIFRAALNALPSRLAVDLARETDPDRVEQKLAAAINDTLAELDAALGAALAAAGAEDQDEDEAA
jgi:hypothetical protein